MKRNPWPYAIVIYFVIFISAMVTWIGFAVRNDQQLVRSDYYEQELKFQNEIDGQTRAAASNISVDYDSAKQVIRISAPGAAENGSVYFYRPSNAKLDRQLALSLKDGSQSIDVRNFEAGLWKLRVSWTQNGAEYRHNAVLILEPTKVSSL
ncbi:MAG: FixH family protein [Limisphaerales bacterium]